MVWRSVFCLSYKPSLFLLSKQTLTWAKTHSHFYLCSVIRCEDNHKNYSEHKKENSRHPSTKAEPLLIPKGSLYMVFYLYLYSSPLCPFNALRKGSSSKSSAASLCGIALLDINRTWGNKPIKKDTEGKTQRPRFPQDHLQNPRNLLCWKALRESKVLNKGLICVYCSHLSSSSDPCLNTGGNRNPTWAQTLKKTMILLWTDYREDRVKNLEQRQDLCISEFFFTVKQIYLFFAHCPFWEDTRFPTVFQTVKNKWAITLKWGLTPKTSNNVFRHTPAVSKDLTSK